MILTDYALQRLGAEIVDALHALSELPEVLIAVVGQAHRELVLHLVRELRGLLTHVRVLEDVPELVQGVGRPDDVQEYPDVLVCQEDVRVRRTVQGRG